jgi:Outer membrane efflux protein
LSGAPGFDSSAVSNWFNWPARFWAVGLPLAETAFDGGRRHAQTAATRAAYDASIADYRQTTVTAFQQVEDNLAALRILEREAGQQAEAVESAGNNLRMFNDRYVGGRDSYLQVITAQTTYLENERNQRKHCFKATDCFCSSLCRSSQERRPAVMDRAIGDPPPSLATKSAPASPPQNGQCGESDVALAWTFA